VQLVSGSFDQLLTFAMFGIVSFSTLTVASVFVLRVRRRDAPRPFRVPGYPIVPGLFVVINVWVLWSVVQYAWTVVQSKEHGGGQALVALAIVLAGFPAYAVFRAKNRVQESR
jgi:APA family basic amino acid/polyamine antiporter